MKKAIIIYQSKKGTTRKMGEAISSILDAKGIATEVEDLTNCEKRDLTSYDYVFLGCWTKGLMVIAQHPDTVWKKIVRTLRIEETSKLVLFTTYKIATGTMFRQMMKSLPQVHPVVCGQIKSKTGALDHPSAGVLDNF